MQQDVYWDCGEFTAQSPWLGPGWELHILSHTPITHPMRKYRRRQTFPAHACRQYLTFSCTLHAWHLIAQGTAPYLLDAWHVHTSTALCHCFTQLSCPYFHTKAAGDRATKVFPSVQMQCAIGDLLQSKTWHMPWLLLIGVLRVCHHSWWILVLRLTNNRVRKEGGVGGGRRKRKRGKEERKLVIVTTNGSQGCNQSAMATGIPLHTHGQHRKHCCVCVVCASQAHPAFAPLGPRLITSSCHITFA